MINSSIARYVQASICLCTLCGLTLLSGCGPAAPVLVPAKGTIKINGKPAGNISIQFLPDVKEGTDGAFPSSTAISKEDGTFELMTTDNKPGAVPGPHRVVLADLEEERVEQGKQATKPPRLDARYAIAGALKANVKDGEEIVLEVQ